MGDRHDYVALEWVKGEIAETLKQARHALEAFVESPQDLSRIRFCLAYIHQVQGTLQMVEFYGAALLAEEMERLAQAMLEERVSDRGEALEVLMQAILQLPVYLERIQTARRDLPLVVLPLLNDLRIARGEALLSETSLFAPDLGGPAPLPEAALAALRTPETMVLLRKLRQMLQLALVGVIRDQDVNTNLGYLAKVFARLESLCREAPLGPLWEIAAALVEGLSDGSVGHSGALRDLLRQVEKELKRLVEQGVDGINQPAPEELLRSLLFYAAKAPAGGVRLLALKARYRLDEALPDSGVVDEERARLAGPDRDAMRSVVAALCEELVRVKDSLDLFVRSDRRQLAELEALQAPLKQVGDTLGMLGFGQPRKIVADQLETIRGLAHGQQAPSDAVLMDVAGALLYVEATLAGMVGTAEERSREENLLPTTDVAQIHQMVIKEARTGLEQAKDAIIEFIASQWNHEHLQRVPVLLTQVRGGLSMIPLARASALVDVCNRYIREQLLVGRVVPDWQSLDTLADAITGVEYYLERLSEDHGSASERLLDVAEESLASLGYPLVEKTSILDRGTPAPAPVVTPAPAAPAEPEPEPAVAELPALPETVAQPEAPAPPPARLEAESPPPAGDAPAPPPPTLAEVLAAPVQAINPPAGEAPPSLLPPPADEEPVDEDLLEVFIEEAGEVLETLGEYFPRWRADSANKEALIEVRRAFHTLKGSGRMVRALIIGELAWSIENLLNRVLDRSIQPTAGVLQVVADVLALMPVLVEEFAAKAQCQRDDVDRLAATAHARARGEEPAGASAEAEVETRAAAPSASGESADELDVQLLEIFRNEAIGHLQTLDRFLAACARELPQGVTDDLQRALHTLKGSAHMAGLLPIAEIAMPLERLVKEFKTNLILIDLAEVELLQRAAQLLQRGLAQLDSRPLAPIDGSPAFLAEVRRLHQERLEAAKEGWLGDSGEVRDPRQIGRFLAEDLDTLLEAEDLLRRWRRDPEPPQELAALRGELDTLGASARQAELLQIDALCQALLALYGVAQAGRLALDERFFDAAEAAHEALIGMLDQVAAALEVIPQPERVAALQALLEDVATVVPVEALPSEEPVLDALDLAEPEELPAVEPEILEPAPAESEPAEELALHALDLAELEELPAAEPEILEPVPEEPAEALPAEAPALDVLGLVEPEELPAAEPENPEPAAEESAVVLPAEEPVLDALDLAESEELPAVEPENPESASEEPAEVLPAEELALDALDLAELEELPAVEPEILEPAPEEPAEALPAEALDLAEPEELPAAEPEIPEPAAEESVEALPAEALDLAELEELPAVEPEIPEPAPEEPAEVLPAEEPVLDALDLAELEELPEPAPAKLEPAVLALGESLPDDGGAEADDELTALFLEEALDLLDSAAQTLPRWLRQPEDNLALTALLRDLHTLKGGARMAGIAPVADLAHELECLYEDLLAHPRPHLAGLDELLGRSHGRLALLVERLPAGLPLGDSQELIQALQDWRRQGAAVGSEACGVARAVREPAVLESLGEARCAESFDAAAPEVRPFHMERLDFATGEDAPADTAPAPPGFLAPACDPELLEIFLEEGFDILESAGAALQRWLKDPSDRGALEALQRDLHTLKGGALMAEMREIGDLAHELEFLYEGLGNGWLAVAPALAGLLQACHDRLAGMLEAVRERTAPPDGEALIAAIRNWCAGSREPVAAAAAQKPARPEPGVPKATGAERLAPSADAESEAAAAGPELPGGPLLVASELPAAGAPSKVLPFVQRAEEAAREAATQRAPQEMVRVPAELLESLVNLAGETSIFRGRVEQQVSDIGFTLAEMESTIERVRDQLRRLDTETQAQILSRYQAEAERAGYEDFDPLEMDRHSQLQQLSRALFESASDLLDLKETLAARSRDAETLLLQQARVNTELQEGLMRTRMVPFERLLPRLRRVVRQVAGELGKQVELSVGNAEGEMDRSVLERIIAPLEHMLRNAVDHGIESAEVRRAAGKPEQGSIRLELLREGGDILLTLADDGGGIRLEAVRQKAIERGLMKPDAPLSDHEALQFILEAGFSTADRVTQISGRGVGMDVVHSEVKQLGGSMSIESTPGVGTRFLIRLPFTVSVNRALMVLAGEDLYAVPLNTIEGIVRVAPHELEALYARRAGGQAEQAGLEYAGKRYELRYLGELLDNGQQPKLAGQHMPLPVILMRSSEQAVAVQVDGLAGSREIVVKSLGPQFAVVPGISGATILGDGRVVVILDLLATLRERLASLQPSAPSQLQAPAEAEKERPLLVLVVDDSVTVRKVTGRLLERHGMDCMTAKDGVDALAQLQERRPDLMLLDIEMPRMDGFEVATRVRHDERLKDLPIIMITSRTGEKHRERALGLGVDEYLGKPYQEALLLEAIHRLVKEPEAR
ncbi:Hpt domain-containing protein [Azotobacter beijerinckii]|uniref:Chemotaxis protein CheA n=1 Tax=Azotobacter beijerinckii TaxID=170623 RepID=A0A1I4A544_9GAMM|nr:Hpt domain-containing protein [Azotobacter beijerinckii]SFK50966.1 chemosensory pili system protein ChpA (sensor histidine kinase/response regulator) [Azotobacter beijerinckii]